MTNTRRRFIFDTVQMTKADFFSDTLARLQDDVGTILDLLEKYNQNSARKVGFWASVRMLLPIVEAVAEVVDEEPWEFMENYLEVTTPSLAWQMFRHSLTHGDLMRHAEWQGKKVNWGIDLTGTGHVIKSGQLHLDTRYLYEKLVEYLKQKIVENDQTLVNIKVGVIYQNPEQYIVDDFNKL